MWLFPLHSVFFNFFHFSQGQCVVQAFLTQSGETLPENFIGFDSVPDKLLDGSVVRVRYQCFRPCQLAVEVVVSTLRKTDLVVFRRKWISSAPRVYRIHQVLLRLPPSVSYQRDFFNRDILDTQNATVRAWLHYLINGSEHGTYHSSRLSISKVLQIMALSERPTKLPTGCPSWSAQLMWQMISNRIHQCPQESGQPLNHIVIFSACYLMVISKAFIANMKTLFVNNFFFLPCHLYTDVIEMLTFPLASTGEHFGVVHRFQPFIDRSLERTRLRAVAQPRLDF